MKWNDEVDRICQQCGQHFTVLAYRLKQRRGRYCSRRCVGAALAAVSNPGRKHSKETRAKLSEKTKEAMQSPERVKACSDGMKRAWQDPEKKVRMLEGQSRGRSRRWQDPKFRLKMSQIRRRLWENPNYKARVVASIVAGLQRKPTKPERRLIAILKKHLPQFRYNGDFSLGITIGGLVPDFVNVNGKKEVIELLGDYFHSPEVLGGRWQGSELGKVMIYNSGGFKCLVIWQSELDKLTDDKIVDGVKSFFSKKRVRR